MSDRVASIGGECPDGTVDEPNGSTSFQRGRFQPGRSGNPKGRPRKRVKVQSAIEAALDEQVTIKDHKGTRRIPAAHAIAKRLVQKAMAGDIPALKELQRASPDVLSKVANEEASKFRGDVRYLFDRMSPGAAMEFRHAFNSLQQKRLALDSGSQE